MIGCYTRKKRIHTMFSAEQLKFIKFHEFWKDMDDRLDRDYEEPNFEEFYDQISEKNKVGAYGILRLLSAPQGTGKVVLFHMQIRLDPTSQIVWNKLVKHIQELQDEDLATYDNFYKTITVPLARPRRNELAWNFIVHMKFEEELLQDAEVSVRWYTEMDKHNAQVEQLKAAFTSFKPDQ